MKGAKERDGREPIEQRYKKECGLNKEKSLWSINKSMSE